MERWLAQAKDLREGTRLYLTNDFTGAEILFKRGFESGAPPVDIADDDAAEDDEGSFTPTDNLEARDMRGAFALQYAIVSLMRGVASLANDQLDECAARLWEADRLAKLDTPWIGKKLVRGVCTLVAGIVQCLQQNIVRGVYNICRSWQWIRYLRSVALEYPGVGSDVVRSSALLALGTFALILSLLPPHLVRAASWTTGFEIDREAGLSMLRTCQEDGIYAPIAALALLSFELDTKTFLGESQSEESLQQAELSLDWAEERFPSSVFFSLLRAELHACRHQLSDAKAVVTSISSLPCVSELRAVNAVVAYKRAVYSLAAMEWSEAADAFAAALAVYKAADRRSLSPAMAMGAALSYFVADDKDKAEEFMAITAAYKALDKSNWQRRDRAAFRVARYRGEEDKPVGDKASASSVGSLARAAFSSAATTEAKPSRPPPPSSPPSDLRAWALLEISHMMTIVCAARGG